MRVHVSQDTQQTFRKHCSHGTGTIPKFSRFIVSIVVDIL